MLDRVLEPEVMDTYEEARDYDAMDHSEVNRVFVDDLLAAHPVADDTIEGGPTEDDMVDVLDVGTGTALVPIELCSRVENCRIMGIDMSVEMLEAARLNIEIAGLIDRIFLEQDDAKELPHRDEMFAVVMSNSIVHHIPDPLPAISEMVRVTEPGGLLFVRDLMRPADDAAVAHLVETYAAGENEHQRAMFEASLRAALTVDEMADLIEHLGFARDTIQATSDRHWTWIARKPAE